MEQSRFSSYVMYSGVFIVILLLFSTPFWYLVSPFYYQCQKVIPGMSIDEAESIMAFYLDHSRVEIFREFKMSAKTSLESPGLYMVTKGLDMRCVFSYEDGKVKETEFYYD